MTTKLERRLKIKAGVRGKISGTTERPRLTVFRSNKQIYAQVIDDTTGKTLAAASSLKLDVKAPKKEIAAKVGELIAKGAQEAGVQTVVFDRNGYLYHGRIKELADAAWRCCLPRTYRFPWIPTACCRHRLYDWPSGFGKRLARFPII